MTALKGRIFELKRMAVHDGDGIRTTVFFKGCPLKCVWCHNPEGISAAPQTAHFENSGTTRFYGQEVTVKELLPQLLEDRDFYDVSGGGVTLSGGECLMQADFCAELLRALKENGVNTTVDTCGFVARESIDKVLPYTDVFLYDVKAIDSLVHEKCTGQKNEVILENLRYIDGRGKDIEVRIVYVPGYNSGEMEKIGEFLQTLKCVKKVRVLPYHNYAGSKYAALGMENTLPETVPTEEELEQAKAVLRKFGLVVL